jgi:hypothetical protein
MYKEQEGIDKRRNGEGRKSGREREECPAPLLYYFSLGRDKNRLSSSDISNYFYLLALPLALSGLRPRTNHSQLSFIDMCSVDCFFKKVKKKFFPSLKAGKSKSSGNHSKLKPRFTITTKH